MANENKNNEEITVTLTLDNDQEQECVQLAILEADGKQFIALLPILPEDDPESGEVYLYRYVESENGLPSLENIQSDEEYELAAEAFDSWLDDQEYDEIVEDDEE